MTKISVIVPVYNCEKYITRCLDSILSQTFQNFECIVVDDGSTDGSSTICDKYAEQDARFTVIHQKMVVYQLQEMQELMLVKENGLHLLTAMIGVNQIC